MSAESEWPEVEQQWTFGLLSGNTIEGRVKSLPTDVSQAWTVLVTSSAVGDRVAIMPIDGQRVSVLRSAVAWLRRM